MQQRCCRSVYEARASWLPRQTSAQDPPNPFKHQSGAAYRPPKDNPAGTNTVFISHQLIKAAKHAKPGAAIGLNSRLNSRTDAAGTSHKSVQVSLNVVVTDSTAFSCT